MIRQSIVNLRMFGESTALFAQHGESDGQKTMPERKAVVWKLSISHRDMNDDL